MAARKITKRGRKYMKVAHGDWVDLWSRVKDGGLRLSGTCDDWCANVCEGDDGCDLAAGKPGRCVALCNDGEVFIQVP